MTPNPDLEDLKRQILMGDGMDGNLRGYDASPFVYNPFLPEASGFFKGDHIGIEVINHNGGTEGDFTLEGAALKEEATALKTAAASQKPPGKASMEYYLR